VSLITKAAVLGTIGLGLVVPFSGVAAADSHDDAYVCVEESATGDEVECNEVRGGGAESGEGVLDSSEGAPGSAETDATGGAGEGESPAAAQQTAPSGSLPITGGDVVGMTIIGAGALAVGTVLVRRSRKSAAATTA